MPNVLFELIKSFRGLKNADNEKRNYRLNSNAQQENKHKTSERPDELDLNSIIISAGYNASMPLVSLKKTEDKTKN